MFLTRDEVAELTGRKIRRLQADQLRRQGIPFRLNAAGWPVVARAAVEGGQQQRQAAEWMPASVRAP